MHNTHDQLLHADSDYDSDIEMCMSYVGVPMMLMLVLL